MIPRLLRHLDLEPGQQELIEGILETARTTIEPLVEQSKEMRNEFHQNYGIGDFDGTAYREFFGALAAIDVEIKLASADAVSQVWKLLTPDQQQQIEDMRGSFGKGMARRGGGRRPTS
jgi:Spy/CpxP family protein refolding chaperone